MAMPQIVKKTN